MVTTSLVPPAVRHGACAAVAVLVGLGSVQAAERVDWIVAVVNDEAILNSEVDAEVTASTMRLRNSGRGMPEPDVLRQVVIESLVEHALQLQRARQVIGGIHPREVDAALADILAANGNMPLDEFVAGQGMSEQGMRERIAEEMLINRALVRDNRDFFDLNDSEVNETLRARLLNADRYEYLLQHVRLPVNERVQANAMRRLSGDAFAERAEVVSLDEDGVELGWQTPERLPTDYLEVVRDLNIGQVSEIIERDDGLHLLRLVARRPWVPGQTRDGLVGLKLLKVGPGYLTEITEALAQIAAGSNTFEDVAERYGGTVEVSQYVLNDLPASIKQGLRLRVGEIDGPFEIDEGFAIALVLDVKLELVGDGTIRDEVLPLVSDIRLEQLRRRWIENLRSVGTIKILDGQS